MSFLYVGFKNRMIIEQMFLEWCDENGIAKKPNSLVAFMLSKKWLNEKKIWEDINKAKGEADGDI